MRENFIEVVRLVASQKGQAAQTLATACQEDPMFAYLFPSAEQRRKSLAWQWEAVVGYSLAHGAVYTTPDVRGVACWLAPGNTRITVWRMLRSGINLRRALMYFEGSALRASLDMMGYLDRIHKRLIQAPHWYLWALGVDPASQGQGIGRRLIQPVLNLADQMGVACYLETLAEENLPFYQKYGFEIANAGEIPRHGLKAWMLMRNLRRGYARGEESLWK